MKKLAILCLILAQLYACARPQDHGVLVQAQSNVNNISMKEFVVFVSNFTDANIVYNEGDLDNLSVNSSATDYIMSAFYVTLYANGLCATKEDGTILIATKEEAICNKNHYSLERGALIWLSDINKVISSMLVSPAYNNGEFLGYRVTRMRDDAPLQALGIQRGDIINRINGEELTNPQILFDMLGKVGDINAISLDVTRGNEKKTIFVEIQ